MTFALAFHLHEQISPFFTGHHSYAILQCFPYTDNSKYEFIQNLPLPYKQVALHLKFCHLFFVYLIIVS